MPFPTTATMARPFQSKAAFVDFIKAPVAPDDRHTVGKGRWSNRDLEPTPVAERKWQWYSLAAFWFSSAFGTTGWNAAASLIATGLTWQQSFIASVLGCLIAAIMVSCMARPGVQYHVGFPVLCRGVMGMWGSYFFVALRGVVCIIWFGIQTFYAANLLSCCFRCIFGHLWEDWANMLPAGGAVTSKQLLCFFLVWFIEVPLVFVHPKKIHWLFTIEGIAMPLATFGLFGWCMANGTGASALSLANTTGTAAAKSTPLGWAVMSGINSILGTLSPMLVNQPDLSRYCNRTRDAGIVQSATLFFTKILVLFIGLASTVSIQGAWGTAYWNIWDLFEAILDRHWTAAGRTAIFVVSLCYMSASISVNIGANSLPFGADFTSLAPKYITIIRGQVICALLGVVVQPWQLLANASEFLSFLGSYNIFMAPICAVWIVDYAYSRRGNVHVPSLYDGERGSLYWYWHGVNWRGVTAWTCGMVLGIPGLVGQYNKSAVNEAARNMYRMGWLLTFFTAGTVYLILSLLSPPKVYPDAYKDMPKSWEYLAKDGREGFFDGEREDIMVISGVNSDVETGAFEESKVGGEKVKARSQMTDE